MVFLHYQQAWTVPQQSHYRSTSVASLLSSLDNTSAKSLASPPCRGSLSLLSHFIYLCNRTMIRDLLFSMGGRGIPTYGEQRRFPIKRSIYKTYAVVLLALFFHLSFLYLTGSARKTLFTCNIELRNENLRIDIQFIVRRKVFHLSGSYFTFRHH